MTDVPSGGNAEADIWAAGRFEATFPERANARPDPYRTCPPRLRLTPARPSRTGSVFRREPVSILNGFETGFTFQITDHSRSCTLIKDYMFSVRSHQSCSVHGGDGFAFVLHLSDRFSEVLGAGHSGLGYAGLPNTLAVEFDTWYNPEEKFEDMYYDHIALQVAPAGGVITSDRTTRVSYAYRAELADGMVHRVKIIYYSYIKYDMLDYMETTEALADYLLDAGENRRIGTLAIYFDNMTTPLVAMPFNLNVALRLPQDQVYMGFTAATGSAWEKHDILDWYLCESTACTILKGDPRELKYRPR